MVFRRRSREAAGDADAQALSGTQEVAAQASAARTEQPTEQRSGPWDEADLDDPRAGRVDFGGLLIPAVAGMQVRVDTQDNRITAISMIFSDSGLQVMPFAAPRSGGIWDEVRAELAASVAKQGGTVDEVAGPFGPELRVKMPVRAADGRRGTQNVRFLGADGPRWFLRGVIHGKAALDARGAGTVERVFREIVVVRGGEPMAPRDPIPLRLPREGEQAQEAQEGQEGQEAPEGQASPQRSQGSNGDINPFDRGPEITEVR